MKVRGRCLLLLLLQLVFLSLLSLCHASAGDDQPPYKWLGFMATFVWQCGFKNHYLVMLDITLQCCPTKVLEPRSFWLPHGKNCPIALTTAAIGKCPPLRELSQKIEKHEEMQLSHAWSCVESCEKSGCVDDSCFNSCKFPVGIDPEGDPSLTKSLDSAYELFLKEPLYLRWKKWDCTSECRYQCMVREEAKRESNGQLPLKYHGKWPFVRFFSLQEPASVAFSVLNLLVHFQGFSSFLVLVYYKLPLSVHGSPHYEYVSLWAVYGLLSMNSWIWSTVFHSRDVRFTEMLDYSSAVALLGYSLILAVIRTGDMRAEAARVMVSAPITAFISTHILYLNLYKFDYGWNMQVCVVIGVTQMLLWAVWAYRSCHPARYKLLTVVFGASLAMLLEIYDFPPLWGILDAHAIWHATTVPITYLWWSFIKDDAKFRTKLLISKTEAKANKSRKSQ